MTFAIVPALRAQNVDYAKAEQFLSWNTTRMISGDQVNPSFLADDTRFWYRNKTNTQDLF